ncbi:MAG: hypothetical protein J6U23_03605 [Clostridiales bacterium]|nr:hypothetical protein [Clostridiales bacterium]
MKNNRSFYSAPEIDIIRLSAGGDVLINSETDKNGDGIPDEFQNPEEGPVF